ncbi:MAG: prolyl oligopeptidase family serine peptidase [Verrucomicrobia bacterium]|nr:prolyl oligopeptidase family serine peptidase [Verrucomicrobiota bacterium]
MTTLRMWMAVAVCGGGLALAASEAAGAGATAHKVGRLKLTFTERDPNSTLASILGKTGITPTEPAGGAEYRIADESFETVVPQGYSPLLPHGLLVWVNAGDDGGIPGGWASLMQKHRLIWIGANRSGNDHDPLRRRLPLALDAVFNMRKLYKIDANRIYVSGFSGGGRVASMLAMTHPEIFSGGIFVMGVSYWEPMKVPGDPAKSWGVGFGRPGDATLALARERGRYALMTGEKDFNREQTTAYYATGYSKALQHVILLEEPKIAHTLPSEDWYEKAIVFLDAHIPKAAPAIPPSAAPPSQALRTWTSSSGATVEARFVRRAGADVILSNAQGAELRIALQNLSAEDRAYVQTVP